MAIEGHRSSPSPARPAVEALSTGRARRATAGSRMRELIEQERERILAEGGGGDDDDDDDEDDGDSEVQAEEGQSAKSESKRKRKAGKEGDDEDAIFRNDANDVDFEARDDADDIIDSDFDLSSNQGSEDEEEGERVLQAEEKMAKKASRAKAVPAHLKRVVAPVGVSSVATTGKESSKPARPTKRISFAPEDSRAHGQQRSSKRKATMDVTLSVQARAKADEERRARQSEVAQPKRSKVRISQADYIADALEMEEQNRESLKRFLQGEEERRERDRKASKRDMQGPFLRWRSVAVDRHGGQRQRTIAVAETKESETGEAKAFTLDPVFEARRAAQKEKQAKQQSTTQAVETQESTPAHSRMTTASEGSMPSIAVQSVDGQGTSKEGGSSRSVPAGPSSTAEEPIETPAARVEAEKQALQAGAGVETPSIAPPRPAVEEKADETVIARDTTTYDTDKLDGKSVLSSVLTEASGPPPPDWEARAYVSLHEVPTSTPWPKVYAHILGSHVDWSRYTVVAARNRPLRPRQSVCPITGLPAKYRDPRSGIAFANCDAYASLSEVMQGSFRWSGEGAATADGEQGDDTSAKASQQRQQKQRTPRYDPLQMGCYLDRIDEPGANDVLLLSGAPTMPTASTKKASTSGRTSDRSAVASRMHVEYVPRNALAPGDEQALVAAALALPAGSTRSGRARMTTK